MHGARCDTAAWLTNDLVVHDCVDAGLRNQLSDDRVADVGVDEVRALQAGARRTHVQSGDVLHSGVALESACEFSAEASRDARDQDASAAHFFFLAGAFFSSLSMRFARARSSARIDSRSSLVAGERFSICCRKRPAVDTVRSTASRKVA